VTTDDRTAIGLYVSGVANELRRDVFKHSTLGLAARSKIVLPRAEKLSGLLRRHPDLLVGLTVAGNALWGGLLYPLLLASQVVSALASARGSSIELASGELFVANSRVALACARQAGYGGPLLLDFGGNVGATASSLPISRLPRVISAAEVLKAAHRAWKSEAAIRRVHRVPGSRLQSYSAFHWHAMYLVLERIRPRDLWFVSDSDSWAVLFDQVPGPQKRVLVQHGLLSDPGGGERDRPSSPLPVRLQNITNVCVLDARSEGDFRRMILEDESAAKSELLQHVPRPEADPRHADGTFRVLIIGQPHTVSEELALVHQTHAAMAGCKLFIKPHPSYSNRPYRRHQHRGEFELLSDSERLHAADAVVTFAASTLVWQYELAGIPALVATTVPQAFQWLVEQEAARAEPS
jgi:hypothetical protein